MLGFRTIGRTGVGVACAFLCVTSGCDTGSVVACGIDGITYTDHIAPIVESKCLECHSADATDRQDAPEGSNFDTYEELVAVIAGGDASQLYTAEDRVRDRDMPPAEGTAMSEDEICQFRAWAAGGGPR